MDFRWSHMCRNGHKKKRKRWHDETKWVWGMLEREMGVGVW